MVTFDDEKCVLWNSFKFEMLVHLQYPRPIRICNTIAETTACTIAISLIHSKIDYCKSLLFNLPATQTNRLQRLINSAACAVTKTPKFHHITPMLESLHLIKIN